MNGERQIRRAVGGVEKGRPFLEIVAGYGEAQGRGHGQITAGVDFGGRRGEVKLGYFQFVARATIYAENLAPYGDFAGGWTHGRDNAKVEASLGVTKRADPEHVNLATAAAVEVETIERKLF